MNKNIIIMLIFICASIFFWVMFFGLVYNRNDEVPFTSAFSAGVNQQNSQGAIPTSGFGVTEWTNQGSIPATSTARTSRIFIPSINVDANIEEVGITYKGNIAAPRKFANAGWYKYGPIPGEFGTAVIDGHVDNGLAFPAVFSNLKNIAIGDSVFVETKENKTLHFVVQAIDDYDYNATTDDIIIQSETPRLLLITCTGTWIPDLKTHNKRLVVTALLARN